MPYFLDSWTSCNKVVWHWDNDTNISVTEVSSAADARLAKLNPKKVHAISLLSHINQAIRAPPRTVCKQIQPGSRTTKSSAAAKPPFKSV